VKLSVTVQRRGAKEEFAVYPVGDKDFQTLPMPDPLVISETKDAVRILTMNRADKRNALDTSLTVALIAAMEAAEADAGINVVTVSGAGSAFCAGADLKEFEDPGDPGHEERAALYARLYDFIPQMTKPVIAAANGFALGGGCALLLSCDMAIAAPDASFGYPEIRYGMVGRGVLPPLVRAVGAKPAFDLLASGRRIDAAEALRLGLVSRIAPDGALDEFVQDIAAEMAAYPPDAVAATKKHLLTVADMNLADGLDYVRTRIKI